MDSQKLQDALVLIEPIVQDIIRKRKEMKYFKKIQENIQSTLLEKKISTLGKEIMYHLKELESIGCSIKDLSNGHIYITVYQNQ